MDYYIEDFFYMSPEPEQEPELNIDELFEYKDEIDDNETPYTYNEYIDIKHLIQSIFS